jgi:hypothetical protein
MTKSLLCNVAILLWMSFISESWFQKCVSRSSDGLVMRLDAYQCPEVSNCSRLHPSGCSSVFNKKSDFLLRHRYGKTAASVKTSGLHRPDAILDKARRGEELQPSGRQGNTDWTPVLIMEITCSKSATVRTLGHTVKTQP